MRITVFTSNQPRHISLIESLVALPAEVFAVMECNTVFPGKVQDFFSKSPVMQEYFGHVIEAERAVFGQPRFLPSGARGLILKSGDLNMVGMDVLAPALNSDLYIVFGSSYIKGPLIEHLVAHRAVNIHMGASPYYRGSSCNFWALYDGRPEYVGATIHMLSRGLDSGDMLLHCFPPTNEVDAFPLGMLAVRSAHRALIHHIRNKTLFSTPPVAQDKTKQLRYTRNRDFTDEVAMAYLKHMPTRQTVLQALRQRNAEQFLRPFVDQP